MSVVFKQVIKDIGALTSDEKALVAHCLISSLEIKQDGRAELAEKRFLELKSGAVKGVSWMKFRII